MTNTLRATGTPSDAEPILDMRPEDKVLAALLPKLQDPSLRPALRRIARAWFEAWAEPLDDPDAELLQACEDFRRAKTAADVVPDDDDLGPLTHFYALMDQLKGMRPATPNGLAEKAKVACSLLEEGHGPKVGECGEKCIEFAYAMLRDLTGREGV